MRHPSEGTLRRLLDEPAGVADADRRHADDCAECARSVEVMRADAALLGAALATDAEVDVDAAWRRLSASPSTAAVPAGGRRARRSRSLLQRPAAAAVAFAVVLTGAGVAAANDWLPVFRTERVAPVSITTADLVALPDLSDYGDLQILSDPNVHEVADAAAAAAETGLDVPEVAELPRGVRGEPVVQVGNKASATFTFSLERAEKKAAESGESMPPAPEGLDGSSMRLEAGPGVAQLWESASGLPALLVGRAVAPTAYSSSGVSFATLRDYLLSLPGLPDGLAEQLRAFDGDGATLPLPVPEDRFTTSTADVDGAEATVLTTRDKTLAAVVWVHDAAVTVVAGSLTTDELLDVARDLR